MRMVASESKTKMNHFKIVSLTDNSFCVVIQGKNSSNLKLIATGFVVYVE